ncbi:putative capsular polysaccharide synthesis family protein [uncultured Aquimarina sp.]|uniref:putative capsular polysaccharide synthesis family protein n=1 Tax=uncultured Aquimarina sp. TaxID=575652 RepID=UPI0026377568|nr:putative capsular polysaccharide synthesis family protein [uncultured Aquimarina sp.]
MTLILWKTNLIKPFIKYYIKDRLHLLNQTKQLQRSEEIPVLIFTMAKVGSSSVYHSLRKQSNIPCFHIHNLSIEEELQAKALCKEKGVYPGSRTPVDLINREIIKKKRSYKIISLFRNPIERNISAFFEAFQIHTGVSAESYKGSLLDLEKVYHEKLSHYYPILWYEKQFRQSTNINVYDTSFDKNKGYVTVNENDIKLLLINSKVDDIVKEKVIKDFCGIENFKLKNVNITGKSKASSLYTDFKNYIRFSEDYLSSLLNTEYMNHFFSEEEKNLLFNKWSK